MRFQRRFRLHDLTPTTSGKYRSDCILLQRRGDRGIAVATDGRAIAIVPVDFDPEDAVPPGGRLIYRAGWKEAHRASSATRDPEVRIGDKFEVLTTDGAIVQGEHPGPFPAADPFAVLPKGEELVRFKLNPELLLTLAKALGGALDSVPMVEIRVFKETVETVDGVANVVGALGVEAPDTGAFGAIMTISNA